jgi:hypothetical protein
MIISLQLPSSQICLSLRENYLGKGDDFTTSLLPAESRNNTVLLLQADVPTEGIQFRSDQAYDRLRVTTDLVSELGLV